uniref:Integrase core domain containing protein n=1 Tax=Solanum tuberosum TaxID=4113 RepID=M1DH28_SOLTU
MPRIKVVVSSPSWEAVPKVVFKTPTRGRVGSRVRGHTSGLEPVRGHAHGAALARGKFVEDVRCVGELLSGLCDKYDTWFSDYGRGKTPDQHQVPGIHDQVGQPLAVSAPVVGVHIYPKLGRPFFATGQTLVDVERGELKFRLNKEEVNFNICRSMKQPQDMNVLSAMEVFDEEEIGPTIEDKLAVETLAVVLMNFETDFRSDYVETVNALHGNGEHSYAPKKLNLDLKNRPSPPTKPSLEEPPVLELKQLPNHLRYVFFGTNNTLPVILAADLNDEHVQDVIKVLIRYKKAIGWIITDIIGIPSDICPHKIQLDEDYSPSIEHQWRLNPPMQEVVKKEIIKWLDARVVYPISNSH